MKKHLLVPVLIIQAIALLSFAPVDDDDPTTNSVITCSDGTVIIPSNVNMSAADQQEMVSIMNSYGSTSGYFVYQTQSGTAVYNSSVELSDLSSADVEYGSNLGDGVVGSGWVYYQQTICMTFIVDTKISGSAETLALRDDLAPILRNYGYPY